MTDRWALLVDAGWLFAAGSTSACGERLKRSEIAWDPAELITDLVAEARKLVPPTSELLRTYWYDGSPNRLPVGAQRDVAKLPDVKLRLGRTARDGQKGVDGLIIHDLITHAYRRTLDDAVVVSGDEDLLDAIESAQANGTRVHLLEIPIGGIADAVYQAVDRKGTLDEAFWQARLHRRTVEPAEEFKLRPATPPPTAKSPEPEPTPAPVRVVAGPKNRPAWMDEPLPASATTSTPAAAAPGVPSIVRVADLARAFADEWLANATMESYTELLASRPYLSRDLDADLIDHVTPAGRRLSEDERRIVRDAFWSSVANWAP